MTFGRYFKLVECSEQLSLLPIQLDSVRWTNFSVSVEMEHVFPLTTRVMALQTVLELTSRTL